MNEEPLPGPLENFLQHPPVASAEESWRAGLLRRTVGVLRGQRRRQRERIAACVAALLVLTALALRAGWHFWEGEQPTPPVPVAKERPKPAAPNKAPQKVATTWKTPLDQEWAAFDAEPPEQAHLYFQTGDRYLDEYQDIESALRCYHQALLCCDARDLAFNPNDNWLVLALKLDHRKEN
jgi:hypothetical protein